MRQQWASPNELEYLLDTLESAMSLLRGHLKFKVPFAVHFTFSENRDEDLTVNPRNRFLHNSDLGAKDPQKRYKLGEKCFWR